MRSMCFDTKCRNTKEKKKESRMSKASLSSSWKLLVIPIRRLPCAAMMSNETLLTQKMWFLEGKFLLGYLLCIYYYDFIYFNNHSQVLYNLAAYQIDSKYGRHCITTNATEMWIMQEESFPQLTRFFSAINIFKRCLLYQQMF